MIANNILLLTDSYKFTHWKQYPPGTTKVYSYFEPRLGQQRFPNVCFFGLQYFLQEYLEGVRVTPEFIDEAEALVNAHMSSPGLFNRAGWEHIVRQHGGRLPVSIKAVPEGTVLPINNVLMTIENTDPECYWLTNYLETLLVQVWYPTTVCTQSREMKMILLNYLDKTGDPLSIDFKLHDFGFRGSTSVESAGIGGCAHLVNFKGTDTVAGLLVAQKYYDCPMAGFSIPAAEHSTITSWGEEHEVDAFRNMLEKYPEGLVAVVSDSYDIVRACITHWGRTLKDMVMNRKGTVVIRPDSGKPDDTLRDIFQHLRKNFPMFENEKHYWTFPGQLRLIQGDGIDMDMMERVLSMMDVHKYSTDNIAFGSGGGLLQKVNRDTLRFAFKCASVTVDGVERDVFKRPRFDGSKASKAGRMKLIHDDKDWKTVPLSVEGDDHLVEVFRDGETKVRYTLEEIRDRAFVD